MTPGADGIFVFSVDINFFIGHLPTRSYNLVYKRARSNIATFADISLIIIYQLLNKLRTIVKSRLEEYLYLLFTVWVNFC